LRTPLRIKFKNQYKADLPFHVLIRACLRRMSALLNAFGEGEPQIDYPGLVRRAEAVSIASQDLRWFDWRRFSFRQDQAMLMGGMVGEVTYRDVPGLFLPLLEFCKKVHIGKQTTFGLGQIEIAFASDRISEEAMHLGKT
jgi:CRISPR/Cas system endoribonuclease Cas6 (RAMP superfamily)